MSMKYLLKISFAIALTLMCTTFLSAQASEAMVKKESTTIVNSLDLSKEQTVQVENVFASYKEKKMAINSSSPDAELVSEKLTDLDTSLAKELSGILNREQFVKWQSMQKQQAVVD